MKKIILYCLLISLYSCNENNSNKKEEYRQEIISSMFLEIVDTSYYYYLSPPFPIPDSVTPLKMIELYTKRNTNKLALIIDTTANSNKKLDAMISFGGRNNELDSIELRLLNQISFEKMKINRKKIKNIGRYELYYKDDHPVFDSNYTVVGEVVFANIIFNEEMDVCGFYYSIYRGPRDAKGEFIVAKKINNKWIVKNKIHLWAS